MMKDTELWMKKLQEKLRDYSEPAPDSSWERLERGLIPPIEKKIFPHRTWTMVAAAVILLTIVSSVSLYFLDTPTADEMRNVQPSLAISTFDALPDIQQPHVKAETVEPALRPVIKDRLARVERQQREEKTGTDQPMKKEENYLPPVEDKSLSEAEEQVIKSHDQPVKEKQQPAKKEEHRRDKSRLPSSKDKLHIPVEKALTKEGSWSMGLSVGNTPGSMGRSSTDLYAGGTLHDSRVNTPDLSSAGMKIPNGKEVVFNEGVPYLRETSEIVNIKHRLPISFGLSARKNIGGGFSLETGLTYTMLSSDAELAHSDQKIAQKLHYLGIPLRVNWNFVDKKLFTLYVSGGGMVEKCIYGELGSEKETVKPLQLSVSGAVGAQVNATKRVGIYVEPGVAYFFDDNSSVQTIRKENPFNFNIQAGIRFTY